MNAIEVGRPKVWWSVRMWSINHKIDLQLINISKWAVMLWDVPWFQCSKYNVRPVQHQPYVLIISGCITSLCEYFFHYSLIAALFSSCIIFNKLTEEPQLTYFGLLDLITLKFASQIFFVCQNSIFSILIVFCVYPYLTLCTKGFFFNFFYFCTFGSNKIYFAWKWK